ncbi:MAG: LysE family translocator [Pseudomonadaceae bacterium]|jgi:threonine/homoserine/homoserine lactone efflux protein|nr:LysE family translocator [Pseudomonadaceae bacterium]
MSLETWLLFSSAALIVILIPGPLSLLMISNSLNYGLARSLPAFAGGVSASIGLLSASALGLGALLLASPTVFRGMQWLGGAYLVYLAWRSWQQADAAPSLSNCATAPIQTRPSSRQLFSRAFGLGASNPKDMLFFAAFLPQFISHAQPLSGQLLLMIVTWALLDLCCKLLYGCAALTCADYLRSGRGQRYFNRGSALLFACAGVAAFLPR